MRPQCAWLHDVDVVVLAEPAELALVRLEHRVPSSSIAAGDVHELRGGEAEAHDRLHEVDGGDYGVVRAFRLVAAAGGEKLQSKTSREISLWSAM